MKRARREFDGNYRIRFCDRHYIGCTPQLIGTCCPRWGIHKTWLLDTLLSLVALCFCCNLDWHVSLFWMCVNYAIVHTFIHSYSIYLFSMVNIRSDWSLKVDVPLWNTLCLFNKKNFKHTNVDSNDLIFKIRLKKYALLWFIHLIPTWSA